MNIKKILVWTITIGLFLIPFIAFIVFSNTFFPFITGKGFTFRILVEILFGLYLMLAALAPEFRPKMSWLTKSVGIFTLVILIADLFSANVMKSLWSNYERMEGFVTIIHLAMYYIVASSVLNTAKRWYQFFNISLVASVGMSIYGILQLLGKLTINQGGVRLDATFGNASYLAIYLVFHIFLALYMYFQPDRKTWEKWMYGLVALLETFILYYTATRGAILGLIGGIVISAIIVAWKEKENMYLRTVARGSLVAVVLIILGFIVVHKASFVQKSPVLSRFASLSTEEIETQGRYYVWPMAVKGFVQSPKTFLIGWGQESFNFVFNKYYDARMYGQEQWFDRTHNIVLDWLIAGGLIGFLAYASLYVALLYCIWRNETGMTVTEKSLLTGMVAAYIFHNMFVFDNLISYILFFSILGYVHTRSTQGIVPQGTFYAKTFSPDVTNYAVMPVLVLATVWVVYSVNIPAIKENVTLIQALSPQEASGGLDQNLTLFKKAFAYNSFGNSEALEQLVSVSSQLSGSAQVPDTTKQAFYDFAKTQVDAKIAKTPHDARYLAFAGTFYNSFGQYTQAADELKKAITESPAKQSLYYELASTYIAERDFPTAFATLKQAYNIEPDSPDAQLMYAVGAIYNKDATTLATLAPKLNQKTLITDNRILQAYATIGDYQSVISILTLRVQSDPTNMQYKLALASAYLQVGQKQKAVDIISQMIKDDPSFKSQGEEYIKQIQNS